MGHRIDPLPFGKKLSDSVFEFYKPKTVHLEVVFIHGLVQGKCEDAYWKTWARDGIPENLWPRTWLPKNFPSARVLALSYDASIKRTATDGRMDLYGLGENLIQEMVDFGRIGQNGVPVVFVCHGFGGLVAKQIVVFGNKRPFLGYQKVQNLLQNIDAFCFYSTPHHGSHLAKSALYHSGGAKGPLLESFKVLDQETCRLNQEFEQSKRPSWHFHVAAESHEISKFREMVVAEASSRYGNATHMTLYASYVDICKPSSKKDSSYQWLTMHLKEVLDRNLVSLPLAIESLASESLVRFQEQEESVKGMLQEFRIVGLIGMGGSGKTTLAKVVYQSICSDFEKSSYLDDVKSKGTLDEVLVTLLRQFGIKNRKTGVEAQLSDFQDLKEIYLKDLKTFVKKHKVLVVVDDVGSEENFNHLLACMDFINGREDSRMIVTCREWQLLRKHAPLVGKYEMKLLNGSGLDIELFSHHVYKGAKTELRRREWLQEYLSRDASGTLISDFESVFNSIVDACAGLPLSLEVMGSCIGSYLKDCDVSSRECLELWRGALQKFRDAEALDGAEAGNERPWKSLRISYDDLGPSLREKFLDVACFFCGSLRYDYNSLLRIWGGKPSDCVDLKNLQDRCLFRVNKEDGVVTMHDQLRDMGRSIVKGDGEYMTRVWTDQDVGRVLQSKESRATVGLSLGDWNKASHAIVRGKAQETSMWEILFSMFTWDKPMVLRCRNLRLIDLRDVQGNICATIVLEDSSSLHWICLRGGNITKVPNFVWKCIHLYVLDLHGCIGFKELSELVGDLVKLLELNLRDCKYLRSLPPSIGNLVNLSSLNLLGCESLTSLPPSTGNLVNLSSLNLGGCGSLTFLPPSIGNLVNLSSLNLLECGSLTSLPPSIGDLVNLSSLNLSGCGSLTSLPPSIGNLVNLSELDLHWCGSLTSLPPSIGNLVNLSSLHLGGCGSLTSLPPSIGNLVNLSSLDLCYCGSLTSLPPSIGNLVNLSELDLQRCGSLTSLPPSIGNLVNLSSFNLGGCGSLTSLPPSIGNLVNLSSLNLGGCGSLTFLPPSIGNLVNLSSLNLLGCGSLTSLPPSTGDLVNLSSLNLGGCGSLTSLPPSIGNLVNLSELDLHWCGSLTSLPPSIGNLVNLSSLYVLRCGSLTSLPPSIGNLVSLYSLDLWGCSSLTSLPPSIGSLVNLSSLNLLGCGSLTSLPPSIGNLVNLSELDLQRCGSLTSLPPSIGNLVNLSKLHLGGCGSLTSLPPSIGNLVNLRRLDLDGCGSLTSLPPSFGNLVNFRP
ncbi:hypothetical protein KC19_11G106800 [Ceratodon purpureus]|uniref:NB-ARC domain-containing protein n=1 Tax=Ceratodon purpureus TaxID=3225 RepID=A0A8T0GDR0_CERPU|nr:hypothetical protein KC19_11G106800 [Ceratodon purpureus]